MSVSCVSAMAEEANFEGAFLAFASLLDAIELALGDEEYDRAEDLVKGRFDIVEEHGLTVEFTGMPVSGEKH